MAKALYKADCQPNRIPATIIMNELNMIDNEPIVFPVFRRIEMVIKSSPPDDELLFKI